MSFVLHLMCLYSPQPTVAIQNCSIVTGDDYARFLRYVASESHLVASGFVRGRIPRTDWGDR